MLSFLRRHSVLILGLIVLFALCTRLYRLNLPKEYIFDEVYHALTAKLIRRNDPRAFEWWHSAIEPNTAIDWLHPPIAKYTQALGMDIFGENSFGWRVSAAVFGTLVVLATALLADELFDDRLVGLCAAALAALDGLLLVQSRIAMNDIHVTFFIILTFIAYVRYRKLLKHPAIWLFLTGLAAGLAMGSKWSGVFALGVVGVFEVQTLWQHRRQFWKWQPLQKFLFLGVLPIVIYLLSYSQMFLQGKSLICEGDQPLEGQCYCHQDSSFWVDWLKKIAPQNSDYWESLEARGGCKRLISHFDELHHQIWWYQTNLTATHPYQSRPWQWFLDLRPVWFYVKYDGDLIGNIYAFGNPLLFWFGDVAVLFTILYVVFPMQKKEKQQAIPKVTKTEHVQSSFPSLVFVLIAYFAVWAFWQFSPRIMFFYHYTPAVPLLCILLAYWLVRLAHAKTVKHGQWIGLLVVILIAACFVIFYPNWTGIPVPKSFAESIYFMIPSWR